MSAVGDLPLIPDAERLLSGFLRREPRISALVAERVYTVFPAQAGPDPLVLLTRVGGAPPLSMPLVVDEAQVQVSCYGGTRQQANELGATCRAALCKLEGTVQPEGVVAGVRFAMWRSLDDEVFSPPRPRIIFDVYVTLRAPTVMGARSTRAQAVTRARDTTREPSLAGTTSPKGG